MEGKNLALPVNTGCAKCAPEITNAAVRLQSASATNLF